MPNFKHLSKVVLKKILNILLCISILQTQDPLRLDQLGPLDHLNKVGKGPLANATYQLLSEPTCSEVDDFLNIFYVFRRFKNRTPGPWPF